MYVCVRVCVCVFVRVCGPLVVYGVVVFGGGGGVFCFGGGLEFVV